MAAVSAFLSKLMKLLQKKHKLFMEIEKIKRFTQNVTIPYVFTLFNISKNLGQQTNCKKILTRWQQ